ncbi:type Z 30S ribosomal protein S14 [Candidatus Roizmanbacteria bacterium]|nr:type Z 30S ribosomal protein S14 [Candidatus Roizmanbacteria bacterium]
MAKTSDEVKFRHKQKYTIRIRNRCAICGRSRGYIRRFGLCRICFRDKALAGEIPGVKKISW